PPRPARAGHEPPGRGAAQADPRPPPRRARRVPRLRAGGGQAALLGVGDRASRQRAHPRARPGRMTMEQTATEPQSQELYRSPHEDRIRRDFVRLFKQAPIPDVDLMANLGLFLSSKNLSRLLFMHHLYQQIVEVPGIVVEFGTRWGQNLGLFAALRGIY